MNQPPCLELRVVETSPRAMAMSVQVVTIQRPDSRKSVFQIVYHRGKSFMGIVAGGSEDQTVLHLSVDNIQGVVALADGGYDRDQQQSPERKLELVTVEKKQKPMTVAEWTLPREKHERPIRIDMITGALKALINE